MQILVVDLGSQYTLNIGRTLRELGVRSVILPPQKAMAWIEENLGQLKGIILSGGAASIYELGDEDLPASILTTNRPVLGICLGMHWIAKAFGGEVKAVQEQRGYGEEELAEVLRHDPLFRHVPGSRNIVWMSHGDSVTRLPPGFRCVADTQQCPIAVMASDDGMVWGVQFHPEVKETRCGRDILLGFLDICKAVRDWKPGDIIGQIRSEVAVAVGPSERCVLAFSGGVDSSTLTAILAPVLGGRLTCVALDHGGLRKDEEQEIAENALAAGCWIGDPAPPGYPVFQLHYCPRPFLEAVSGAGTDAEAKRRAFRTAYRQHLESAAKKLGATVLIQGTLAPDIIESGAIGEAALIVTHHNVGMASRLRELHPLANLFKYEVRELARHLKLPPSIAERKPFPGPGLYCRVVGAPVTAKLVETVRWADAEVRQIVAEANLEPEFDQLVVALLCINVAGVKGDGRAYAYLAAIRAVKTSDFMTCRGYRFPPRPDNPAPVWKRIEKALVRNPLIVGVVADETDKPPRRTEFE